MIKNILDLFNKNKSSSESFFKGENELCLFLNDLNSVNNLKIQTIVNAAKTIRQHDFFKEINFYQLFLQKVDLEAACNLNFKYFFKAIQIDGNSLNEYANCSLRDAIENERYLLQASSGEILFQPVVVQTPLRIEKVLSAQLISGEIKSTFDDKDTSFNNQVVPGPYIIVQQPSQQLKNTTQNTITNEKKTFEYCVPRQEITYENILTTVLQDNTKEIFEETNGLIPIENYDYCLATAWNSTLQKLECTAP